MSISKHGLGRGINSLIGEYDNSSFEVAKLEEVGAKVQEIKIDYIKPNPNQPRKVFDPEALEELKQSILVQGVIMPLIVEEIAKDNFVIVAGERRYRASKLAGLETLPCIVRNFTDMQRMEVALIENIQREDLNPVEEAKAFSYLITEQGIKQEDLANRVGKSRPAISNSLRLLNLPSAMLDSLSEGRFTAGHARALLSVDNPSDREILYKKILNEDLSVRQAELTASNLNKGIRAVNTKVTSFGTKNNKSEDVIECEEKFLQVTGCQVEIKGKISKGKLVLPFDNAGELERIYQLFAPGEILFDTEEEIDL